MFTSAITTMLKVGGCSVRLDFNGNKARERKLTPLCLDVLSHFESLQQRLDCFFAVAEDEYLIRENGRHFRGFQISYKGRLQLPQDLSDRFFHPYDGSEPMPTFEEQLAFDHLVYIRNTTCLDTTGVVLTLAHELQHVAQHCRASKVLIVNNLLYRNALAMNCCPNFTVVDIPSERDANIVSKRIGEIVCGINAVKAFADTQIERFTHLAKFGDESAQGEKIRWEFFRTISSAADYNWIEATKTLIAKCKKEIVARNLGQHFGLDFNKEEWWN